MREQKGEKNGKWASLGHEKRGEASRGKRKSVKGWQWVTELGKNKNK